jgi:hypothetical protein
MNEKARIKQLEKEIEYLKEVSELKQTIARLEGQIEELKNRPYWYYSYPIKYQEYEPWKPNDPWIYKDPYVTGSVDYTSDKKYVILN